MIIEVGHAHFLDITAISSLAKAVVKFRREGIEFEVVGGNEASVRMVDKFSIHDKTEVEKNDLISGH